TVRIVSWNVNGLRAAHKKGFLQWLAAEQADVVGVQEVRALEEQLPEEVRSPKGWRATHFVSAVRPGYSGVGLFARKAPDDVETRLGVKEMDAEGRLQVARFGRLTVVNCYFPNGNGKERDNSRIPFKLDFYRRLFARLEKGLRDGERILVMGDFNTAHQEIDLARPKDNRETSGFLPEEREEFDRWIRAGWVDTFRHFEKGTGHYSWWSQRFGVRERNIGWRLDYVLASPGAMSYVKRAAIHPLVLGSDHCPVSVDLDPKVRR
ncbi:MAG TPA: exodeoxyribonuclease III, partial [Archangium sp.]|nr:exodeoxyribonuclease III [Archangium sp.]